MATIAIIPARSGSKRLPKKNLMHFAGKPLFVHTVEQALNVAQIDKVHVSTDSPEIRDIAVKLGADVPFLRPDELATDTTSTFEALKWVIEQYKTAGESYSQVILLQPTSPLRTPEIISQALSEFSQSQSDTLISVVKAHNNPYFNLIEKTDSGWQLCKENGGKRSQDCPDVYAINGSIYIWETPQLLKASKSVSDNIDVFLMPKSMSIDIDDEIDFMLAECLFKSTLLQSDPQ